jgi:hypothetical protein
MLGAAVLSVLAAPASAHPRDVYVDVDVYRPRPVYVAPRVIVIGAGPSCVVRRSRIWVGDHYAYRKVRRCY